MAKVGVLLINLGTPDDCQPKAVYAYLKEFLNDPRVVDLPKLVRYLLVNCIIVPFRYKQSAHAYQQVWTENGSPLLVHSQALVAALSKALGNDFEVVLGMRYGNPSIQSTLDKFKDCQKIIVLPLFPQYSSAATGSAIEAFLTAMAGQWNVPDIHIKKDFFNHPSFIHAYAMQIKERMKEQQVDLLIFSYHGLPERHIDKSACRANCNRLDACPKVDDLNAYCYRAQCYETSRLIADALKIDSSQYEVSFQSRLGRTPWIKPYTDVLLPDLRKRGIRKIAIVCPSFVSDCLETLEEIDMRARAQWQDLGGDSFIFIPCINEQAFWVEGLAEMLKGLR